MVETTSPDFSNLSFRAGVMPALFVGHGSPMNALEANEFSATWATLGKVLPRPAAILCVSAHWLTRGTAITTMERPQTIHDFWGFPPELHAFQYPAGGSPAWAKKIAGMMPGASVELDQHWGLDHGAWVVLARMYPAADVPVLQLSIDQTRPAAYHYRLGQELAALRREGVLILGSGNIVHNLGRADFSIESYEWAREFDVIMAEWIEQGQHERILDYPALGKLAHLAVPTNDHFLPLAYVIGAQDAEDRVAFSSERVVFGSISMRNVLLY